MTARLTLRRGWLLGASLALVSAAGCKHCSKSDDVDAELGCPAPIHPDYCRRDCKSFLSRRATRHASRVDVTEEGRLGTCGPYDVFTQRDVKTDASIVEYYDRNTSELVGATDPRANGCTKFGTIPECTLELLDLPWPWTEYRVVESPRDADASALDERLHDWDSDRNVQIWDCYLNALWVDASARGTLRLAISRDSTSDAAEAITVEPLPDASASDAGPPLGDQATAACVARAFREHPFAMTAGIKLVVEVSLHPLVVSRDR